MKNEEKAGCSGSHLWSQHFGRPRLEDGLSPGIGDQCEQHSETPISKSQPGVVMCTCGPSYLGGRGGRMTGTQEVEAAVSCDVTTALQPG